MDEDLISKKELLEFTGISYGQLYRWKRKKLIPEDWFIRKSTFTGQETFFPREKILDRVEKIKGMKEEVALDQLADILTPNLVKVFLSADEVVKRNIVTKETMEFYQSIWGGGAFSFDRMVGLVVLEKALRCGEISRDEAKTLLEVMEGTEGLLEAATAELFFVRKMGLGLAILAQRGKITIEAEAKLVFRQEIAGAIEELKLILK